MDSGRIESRNLPAASEDERGDTDWALTGQKSNLKNGDLDARLGDGVEGDGDDDDVGLAQDYSKFSALMGSNGGATGSPDLFPKRATHAKQISAQTIRRGEKDFEAHGTFYQSIALESSRAAMEAVLSYTRVHGIGGADSLRGWYFPDAWMDEEEGEEEEEDEREKAEIAGEDTGRNRNGSAGKKQPRRRFAHTRHRVVMVEAERGPMFASVGAVPGRKRASWVPGLPKEDQPPPPPGFDRVWLLPEEALFLVERGSMELWWPQRSREEIVQRSERQGKQQADENDGVPLSLQAAYALLIHSNGGDGSSSLQQQGRVSLPFFQVYSHLRRAGYQVLRAAGHSAGSTSQAAVTIPSCPVSLWQWLVSLLVPTALTIAPSGSPLPYGPLVRPGLYNSYRHIYTQMQLIPTSLAPPPSLPPAFPSSQLPFHIDFHVWKSSITMAFSKTRPSPPDFFLAIADARTSAVPSLEEIDILLASIQDFGNERQHASGLAFRAVDTAAGGLGQVYRRLKQGHGSVVMAVVDHGLVNYMRFGYGPFRSEPLWTRFDGLIAGRGTVRERRGKGGGKQKGNGKGKGSKVNTKMPQGKGKAT